MMFKVRITVLDGDSLIGIKVRHQNTALKADAILVNFSRCHYIALGKSFQLFSFIYFQQSLQTTCNENALRCIKLDLNHVAIHLQCIEIDILLYFWYNPFSVEEFNEEVDRAYNTKGHLNEHRKPHTQGRSPPCTHCGKDFSGKYGLKSNLLSCPATPGGVPEKQFQCEICGKAYYRQSELTRHQKSKRH